MNNKELILKITDGNKARRIEKILSFIYKNYVIQTAKPRNTFPTSIDITNIIIPAKDQKNKIAIVAHHDVYPGSHGYNDNSSGVIILLKLQQCLPDNVELVFTDGEERGGQGCRYYLENYPRPTKAINIDVVGLGNKIFYEAYGQEYYGQEYYETYGGLFFTIPKSVEYYSHIPFSDSYILADYDVPNILLLTGSNKDHLIREIFEAQHTNKNDGKIDLIREDIMNKVFDTVVGMIK
jgi:Zn-dependent M28 family amino/carboxypeptidase